LPARPSYHLAIPATSFSSSRKLTGKTPFAQTTVRAIPFPSYRQLIASTSCSNAKIVFNGRRRYCAAYYSREPLFLSLSFSYCDCKVTSRRSSRRTCRDTLRSDILSLFLWYSNCEHIFFLLGRNENIHAKRERKRERERERDLVSFNCVLFIKSYKWYLPVIINIFHQMYKKITVFRYLGFSSIEIHRI